MPEFLEVWDQYSAVVKHTQETFARAHAAAEFARAVGDAHRELAKKIDAAAKTLVKKAAGKGGDSGSTLDAGVQGVAAVTTAYTLATERAASMMLDNAADGLQTWLKSCEKATKEVSTRGAKLYKEWEGSRATLEKAYTEYTKACQEAAKDTAAAEKAPSDAKKAAKVVASNAKADGAHSKYVSQLDATNRLQRGFAVDAMPALLRAQHDACVSSETEISSRLTAMFDGVKAATAAAAQFHRDGADAIAVVDGSADAENWAQAESTGRPLPAPLGYLAVDGAPHAPAEIPDQPPYALPSIGRAGGAASVSGNSAGRRAGKKGGGGGVSFRRAGARGSTGSRRRAGPASIHFGLTLDAIMAGPGAGDGGVPAIMPALTAAVTRMGGEQTKDVFSGKVRDADTATLRASLEKGVYDVPGKDPRIPAAVLVSWLSSLAAPIFPEKMCKACYDAADHHEQAVALIPKLPEVSRRVLTQLLVFIIGFANDATGHTLDDLALTFQPGLVRGKDLAAATRFVTTVLQHVALKAGNNGAKAAAAAAPGTGSSGRRSAGRRKAGKR